VGKAVRYQQDILETGDLQEALNAAEAIGDDRLQQQSQGRVPAKQSACSSILTDSRLASASVACCCCWRTFGSMHMQQQDILETGDLQEALNAAEAIGDDRLQQQSQGVLHCAGSPLSKPRLNQV
jgi:predicted metalloprotease